MLPKKLRLPSAQSQLVYKFGKRAASDFLQVQFWQNPTQNSKWMIQVPKKQIPKASGRNRIKRLISEAIVALTPTLKKQGSLVVKFTKNSDANSQSLKLNQVKESLDQAVKKLGLI